MNEPNEQDTELTDEEHRALTATRRDRHPPPALEQEIVGQLRRRGLIATRWPPRRVATWAAAVAALLVIGLWAGVPGRMTTSVAREPRFVLLLYAGEETRQAPGESRRREYADWARRVANDGVAISGDELDDAAEELGGDSQLIDNQPRGYFVISARDVQAAVRIAATCPHLRHGGRIVVRRIVS